MIILLLRQSDWRASKTVDTFEISPGEGAAGQGAGAAQGIPQGKHQAAAVESQPQALAVSSDRPRSLR